MEPSSRGKCAGKRKVECIYIEVGHTLYGCLGALNALWESVYRSCDFLDQGRHRLWVDLLVGVGQ